MDFEYKEIYKYPTHACLNITDNCNLACKYCFVQQKPHYMSLDTAKKAVDYLISNLEMKKKIQPSFKDNVISVTFFGGEPTLLWSELIEPLVLYSKEKYAKQVKFGITTNGTLLNEKRIDFLKENNIPPLLSIDGHKTVQDFNRPTRTGESSFELVEKNIPYLLKLFPNTTFRSTIYQYSCEETYNAYKFAQDSGFTNMFLCPNSREVWSNENIEKLNKEIHKIYLHFILSFMEGKKPIELAQINKSFQKILKRDLQVYNNNYESLDINRNIFRCGLGTTSMSISFDGRFFSCQEQDSRDSNHYFYFGNLNEGVNVEKHKIILQDYNQKFKMTTSDGNLCQNCKLRTVCVDEICPSVSYDLYQNMLIKPEIDCLYKQQFFNDALFAMDILVNKENNQLFKKYLNNLYAPFRKKVLKK